MSAALVFMGLAALSSGTRAAAEEDLGNDACYTCHEDKSESHYVDPAKFAQSAHARNQCISCHKDIQELPHEEKLKPVDCTPCHRTESEVYASSYHGKALSRGNSLAASCRDCHGHAHSVLSSSDPKSPVYHQNIPATCGRCHGDAEKMKPFRLAQSAPVQSYDASVHGLAVEGSNNVWAAVCTDCHGSHDLYRAKDAESRLHWKNIQATCGACHEKIRATYSRSVHGAAIANGNRDAPVCTDCHGEHSISAVKSAQSKVFPSHITETCGQCHAAERLVSKYNLSVDAVNTYKSSFHGLSQQLGSLTAANCASCHSAHDILPASDPRSSVNEGNLPATCGRCHPGVSDFVAQGKIHSGKKPDQKHPAETYVRQLYLVLIAMVLGGMFLHNVLDFYGKVRAHYRANAASGEFAQRWSVNERLQHVVLALSFIILGYTGFALKFPESWWARPFVGVFDWRGLSHRLAAIAFCALAVYHLIYILFTAAGRRQLRALAFGPADLVQPFQMFAFYLGLRKHKPVFGFYSYIEKMEYWALVWGAVIMAATGSMMTWEGWMMRTFPKWVYDVISAVHYYEAILACGAIVLWHFYFVIFDPDEYPLKTTCISGKETSADKHHRKA